MRDLAVTLIVFGLLPYILMRPQIGIYTWSWLGYMNPHRMAWGFAYNFPFSMLVALATLAAILFWKGKKTIPVNALTVTWGLFLAWMLITTLFAIYPNIALVQYEKVMKIQLITVLTMMVIRSRQELNILVWVIALSIGYFGIKGGVFTIQTLGSFRVWGPPGSFIEGNNELALAMLMVLPLFYYLRLQAQKVWLRQALLIAMFLMLISAIGSQSRGGALAAVATGLFLWAKTPNKFFSGFALVLLTLGVLTFMPESWHERIDTIFHYEEDASAMGRITAWQLATNLANDRIVGGGFDMWSPMVYQLYLGGAAPESWVVAHSIYFSVLGEHGWIGLILFLTVFFLTWKTSKRIIRDARGDAQQKWLSDFAKMMQVSLVAYATGGAFLSLSYFDLPWHIVAMLLIARRIQQQAQTVTQTEVAIKPEAEVSGVTAR